MYYLCLTKQKSTCNAHQAVNQANANRHNLESTGIGATACACHSCFVPHSVVDFQKGERQMNMDYSLCQAINYQSQGIRQSFIYYDIACQYFKHLNRRIAESSYLYKDLKNKIDKAVGLFHIHMHKSKCFPR
jgi:hypothetical protein